MGSAVDWGIRMRAETKSVLDSFGKVKKASDSLFREQVKGSDKVTKTTKKNAEERSKAELNLNKKLKKLLEDQIAAHEDATKSRLKNVKKGSEEEFNIIEKSLKKQESLRRKHAATVRKIEKGQTKGKESLKGRLAFAENVAAVVDSVQAGDIGAGLAAIGGKIPGIGGAIVDVLGGVTTAMNGLIDQSVRINQQWILMEQNIAILNPSLNLTKVEIENLSISIRAIPRAIGQTEEMVAQLAAKVATFTEPKNIVATTKSLLALEQVAKKGGSGEVVFDKLIAGAARFEKGGGSIDLMAQAIRNLGAAAEDAADEIATELGAATGKFADEIGVNAAKEATILFTAIAKNSTEEISEATARIEQLGEGLTAALNDPAMMETIRKSLPEGVTLASIGLEKGNVSAIKLTQSLQSMGEEGNRIARAIGGGAGETLVQLNTLFADAPQNFENIIKSFENTDGAAIRLAASLTTQKERWAAIRDQRISDMFSNLGNSLNSSSFFMQELTASALGFIASADFASVLRNLGPIGERLMWLRGLFVDASLEAARMRQAAADAKSTLEVFQQLNTSLQVAEGDTFISKLEREMPVVEAASVEIAAEISKLIELAKKGDPMAIIRIKEELINIENIKAGEAISAMNDQLKATREEIEDLAGESKGWMVTFAENAINLSQLFLGPLAAGLEIFGIKGGDALVAAMDTSFVQIKDTAIENLGEIKTELDALKAKQKEGVLSADEQEELSILSQDYAEALAAAAEAKGKETVFRGKVNEFIAEEIAGQKAMSEEVGIQFDKEVAINALRAELIERLEDQPEILQDTLDKLDETVEKTLQQADATEDVVKAQEQVKEVKLKDLDVAGQSVDLVNQQLDLAKALGVEAADKVKQEILQLIALKARNEAILIPLQAKLKAIRAAIEGTLTEAQALKEVEKQERVILALRKGQDVKGVEVKKVSTKGLDAQAKALEGQIKQIKAVNAGIDDKIRDLSKAGGGARGGRAAKERDKEEKSLAVEAKKRAEAEAKLAKFMKDIAQKRIEAEEAYNKAIRNIMLDREKEERDAAFDLQLAQRERAKAEKQLTEQLANFAKGLDKQIAGDVEKAFSVSAAELEKGISKSAKLQRRLDDLKEEAAKTIEDYKKEAQEIGKRRNELVTNIGKLAQELKDTTGSDLIQTSLTLLSKGITKFADIDKTKAELEDRAIADAKEGVAQAKRSIAVTTREIKNKELNLKRAEKGDQANVDRSNKNLELLSKISEKLAGMGTILSRAEASIINRIAGEKFVRPKEKTAAIQKGISGRIKDIRGDLPFQEGRKQERALQQLKSEQSQLEINKGILERANEILDKQKKLVSVILNDWEKAREELFKVDGNIKAMKNSLETLPLVSFVDSFKIAALGVAGVNDLLGEQIGKINEAIKAGNETDALNLIKEAKQVIDPAQLTAWIKEFGNIFNSTKFKDFYAELRKTAVVTSGEVATEEQKNAAKRLATLDLGLKVFGKLVKNQVESNKLFKLNFEEIGKINRRLTESASTQQMAEQILAEEKKKLAENRSFLENAIILHAEQLFLIRKRIKLLKDQVKLGKPLTDNQATQLALLEKTEKVVKRIKPVKLLEGTEKDRTAAFESANKTLNQIGTVVDLVSSSLSGVETAVDAFSAGDVAGGVQAVGDLTSQIGQALLQAPYPLNLVGAIMILGGKVASLISKIVSLVQGSELSSEEIAQRRADAHSRIVEQMERESDILENQIALGNVRVDQAKEELAQRIAINNALIAQSEISSELGALSQEQLADTIREAGEEKSIAERRLDEAEFLISEGSRREIGDFLRREGRSTKGSNKKRLRSFISDLKAQLIDVNLTLEEGARIQQLRVDLMELEKEIVEEEVGLLELRIQLGADEGEQLEAILAKRRESLNIMLQELIVRKDITLLSGTILTGAQQLKAEGFTDAMIKDIQNISNLTEDELKDLLLRMTKNVEKSQISDQIKNLIQDWIGASGALSDYNESQEENIKNNNEQMDQLKRTDSMLVKLIRRNQDLVELSRLAAKGGTISAQDKARIAEVRSRIASRMRETGSSQAEIDAVLSTLPQFGKGGLVDFTGLIRVHGKKGKPEFMVDADAVSRIGLPFLQDLNKGTILPPNPLQSPSATSLRTRVQTREAQVVNKSLTVITNFNGPLTISSVDPFAAAENIAKQAEPHLLRNIQRAIKQGQLDPERN